MLCQAGALHGRTSVACPYLYELISVDPLQRKACPILPDQKNRLGRCMHHGVLL